MGFEIFLDTANEVLVLITGLIGLVGTGISTYFAIKNWIANVKAKNSDAIWKMLMEMADKAMEEAERTGASGADKKEMVLKAIEAGAEAAGIETSMFFTQLDTYIDQTIDFFNKMKKAQNK